MLRSVYVRRALAFLALGLAALLAFWMTRAPQRQIETPRLTVVPEALEVGEVWEDPDFVWTLPIKNESDETIEIQQVTSSCGCLEIEPQSFAIPAGQTIKLRLTLDLAYLGSKVPTLSPNVDGAPLGDFAVRITPDLGGRFPNQVSWVLRGRVRKAFVLSPQFVEFGEQLTHTKPFASKTVTLKPVTNLQQVTADCDPFYASVTVTEYRGEYSVLITPKESLRPGRFDFWVTLNATTRSGAKAKGRLNVSGNVQGEFSLVPEMVVFSTKPLGETVEEVIVLRSRSRKAFEIIRVESPAPDVKVQPLGATHDSGQQLRVAASVSHVGSFNCAVRVVLRVKDAPAFDEVVLPITYHGRPTRD